MFQTPGYTLENKQITWKKAKLTNKDFLWILKYFNLKKTLYHRKLITLGILKIHLTSNTMYRNGYIWYIQALFTNFEKRIFFNFNSQNKKNNEVW